MVWPSHLLYPLPAGMDFLTGALLEPLGVAIHAVDLAKVRLADTVAVLGAGSIGLLAVRLARLSGAARVFATDVRLDRLAVAARPGGARGGRRPGGGSGAVAPRAHRRAGGGRGHRVRRGPGETLGRPHVAQAVEAVRPGGTVVVVGIPPDDRVAFGARRRGARG